MRFNLNLSLTDRNRSVLPVNYQYELSSWIYKVINQSDPVFAKWLHDRGFSNDNKQFRLFTFSNLMVPQYEIAGDRLIQFAFGWEDFHLYQFSPKGYGSHPLISIPSKDDWEQADFNSMKTKLNKVF